MRKLKSNLIIAKFPRENYGCPGLTGRRPAKKYQTKVAELYGKRMTWETEIGRDKDHLVSCICDSSGEHIPRETFISVLCKLRL